MLGSLMMMALLAISGSDIAQTARRYHVVPLEKVAASKRTHVETCGPVVYRRRMADGDWHITLDNGRAKVVVEIIPLIPLTPPRKGDLVRVRGIRRYDDSHKWPEIHPAEQIAVVPSCG